jgi:hypothetical protein
MGPGTVTERFEFGTRQIGVSSVVVAGARSGSAAVSSGEPVVIAIAAEAKVAVDDLTLGIAVRDTQGRLVYGTNSRQLGAKLSPPPRGPFNVQLAMDSRLGVGEYGVSITLHRGESHLEGCYHWIENATVLNVVRHGARRFEGLVDLGLQFGAEPIRNRERFDVRDPRIGTQVGVLGVDGRIASTGRGGVLLFGPYVAWPPGDYRIRMFGEVALPAGPANFDVVHQSATRTAVAGVLRPAAAAGKDAVIGELAFSLAEFVGDVEVRVFVAPQTTIAISGYEIVPAAAALTSATLSD